MACNRDSQHQAALGTSSVATSRHRAEKTTLPSAMGPQGLAIERLHDADGAAFQLGTGDARSVGERGERLKGHFIAAAKPLKDVQGCGGGLGRHTGSSVWPPLRVLCGGGPRRNHARIGYGTSKDQTTHRLRSTACR